MFVVLFTKGEIGWVGVDWGGHSQSSLNLLCMILFASEVAIWRRACSVVEAVLLEWRSGSFGVVVVSEVGERRKGSDGLGSWLPLMGLVDVRDEQERSNGMLDDIDVGDTCVRRIEMMNVQEYSRAC